MILSQENALCSGQSFTTVVNSANTIDLGATGTVPKSPAALVRDPGPGEPVVVALDLKGTAGDTISVSIINSAAPALTAPVTITSGAIVLPTGGAAIANLSYLPDGCRLRFLGLTLASSGAACVATGGIIAAKHSDRSVPGAG